MAGITPSQTVGPYFGIMVRGRSHSQQLSDRTLGTRIVIEGQIFDGEGAPIPDAFIETWQADANGRYSHVDDGRAAQPDAGFNGYGWQHSRKDGGFTLETIKPGRVPGPDGRDQAPHIVVSVMARGILTRFVTRIYFDDEVSNAEDAILSLVPQDRRHTLIAARAGDGRYRFNLVMQGKDETVFFDV
jgi:protocatechuate 3,4-dioxygenase alpha subunit